MNLLTATGATERSEWIYILLLLVVFPGVAWGLSSLFSKNKKMTAPATVVSHRLALSPAGGRYSDNWNRLVTFRLSDNTELELYTTKEEYETLIDGQSGQLTWEDDLFLHFDPDPML